MLKRKLRMGMVGGGKDAFIGGVHRIAALMDGTIELVCGAFSANPEKSKASGEELFVNRTYGSFEEMILQEKKLPEDVRMDFISIVTPNHMHFAPAKLALENGFHVICDKPVTFSLEEAKALKAIIEETKLVFALTHNYTGYPMVKEAKHMIKTNQLGEIRKVVVEYPQGWLSQKIEDSDQKQAAWRTDPKKSGKAGAIGDIGTHAENLAEYITGLEIEELAADLTTFVEGRQLDDDGSVLLRFKGGAKGILFCSQIACGDENELKIRVNGSQGSLEWLQSCPHKMIYKRGDKPQVEFRNGGNHPYLSDVAKKATRLPAGHPEGYLEAFANIYLAFGESVCSHILNGDCDYSKADFPQIKDGIRGMQFIDAVVDSNANNAKWTKL